MLRSAMLRECSWHHHLQNFNPLFRLPSTAGTTIKRNIHQIISTRAGITQNSNFWKTLQVRPESLPNDIFSLFLALVICPPDDTLLHSLLCETTSSSSLSSVFILFGACNGCVQPLLVGFNDELAFICTLIGPVFSFPLTSRAEPFVS